MNKNFKATFCQIFNKVMNGLLFSEFMRYN